MGDWIFGMMMKLKYFLLGTFLSGSIFSCFLLSWRGIEDKPNADYVAVEKATKETHCPDGATMEYRRWGESGWMASCQMKHGSFVAAEHGHIVIMSEFLMGKEIGETKVFDEAGKLVKSTRKAQ